MKGTLAQTTAVRALSKTFLRPRRVRALHSRYLMALISLASFWPAPHHRKNVHHQCGRAHTDTLHSHHTHDNNQRWERERSTLFGRDGVLLVLLELFEGLGILPQIDLRAHQNDRRRRAVMPQLGKRDRTRHTTHDRTRKRKSERERERERRWPRVSWCEGGDGATGGGSERKHTSGSQVSLTFS